jgi:hypothetical protein
MRIERDFGSASKAIGKYLAGHAEAEVDLCDGVGKASPPFADGLLIPSYGEGEDVISSIGTIPISPRGPVLTILIVNSAAESPAWVREGNRKTLRRLAELYPAPHPLNSSCLLYSHPSGALLVIDRSTTRPLPRGQGVGLARKIGADLLLALIASGRIGSRWIHCSDADVIFPGDYFRQVEAGRDPDATARIYRFRHRMAGDPAAFEAALQYEISLRYYVLGLRFARSPYAFHSVGSTLAIEAGAYAQVRGFPRRLAAEDFYLLDKLAKLGSIEELSGAPLELSSRISSRVPFGTGAAIGKFLKDESGPRKTYDPLLFSYLRVWQTVLKHLQTSRASAADIPRLLAEFSDREPRIELSPLLESLRATGALAAAEAALFEAGPRVGRRLHDTFDGFRTLKFLHALRESGLADIALPEALERASFIPAFPPEQAFSSHDLARWIEVLDFCKA